MSKSHTDYNEYTPELLAELRAAHTGRDRVEMVKFLEKRLKISDRNARRIYVKYINPSNVQLVGRPIRRLFLDIETSPNVVLSWRIGYKINLDHSNVLKERAVICIGYKWEGDDKTYVIHWDDNQNDKGMLSEFIKVLEEADEIIGHNGDRFDMAWIRTRCLFHGLRPIPDRRQVDTLKWAKSKFYFNSNRLDYIAKFLGMGGKIKTEFNLWKDIVLKKCPIAMKKMTDYCAKDVILLEKVWYKLNALMAPKTHVGVLQGGEKWSCPRTGSTNVKLSKVRVTAAGSTQYQMKNTDDDTYYTISATAYEAYKEANGK